MFADADDEMLRRMPALSDEAMKIRNLYVFFNMRPEILTSGHKRNQVK